MVIDILIHFVLIVYMILAVIGILIYSDYIESIRKKLNGAEAIFKYEPIFNRHVAIWSTICIFVALSFRLIIEYWNYI